MFNIIVLLLICQIDAAPKMTNTVARRVDFEGAPGGYERLTLIGARNSYASFDDSNGLKVVSCTASDSSKSTMRVQCTGENSTCVEMLQPNKVGVLPDKCGGSLIVIDSYDDKKLYVEVAYTLTSLQKILASKSPAQSADPVEIVADYSNNEAYFDQDVFNPLKDENFTLSRRGLGSFLNKIANFVKESLTVTLDESTSFESDSGPVTLTLADQSFQCASADMTAQGKSSVAQLATLQASVTFRFRARVQFGVRVVGTLIPPKLEEGYAYVRAGASVSAEFNFDANLYSNWHTQLKSPAFPITPFSIPGVVTIGPSFGVDLDITASLALSASIRYRADAQLADVYLVAGILGTDQAGQQQEGNPLKTSTFTSDASASPAGGATGSNAVAVNGQFRAGLKPYVQFGISAFKDLLQAELGLRGEGYITANFGASATLTAELTATPETVNTKLQASASFDFALYYGLNFSPYVMLLGKSASILEALQYSTGDRLIYQKTVTVGASNGPGSQNSSNLNFRSTQNTPRAPQQQRLAISRRQLPNIQLSCLNVDRGTQLAGAASNSTNSTAVSPETQALLAQIKAYPKYGFLSNFQPAESCPWKPRTADDVAVMPGDQAINSTFTDYDLNSENTIAPSAAQSFEQSMAPIPGETGTVIASPVQSSSVQQVPSSTNSVAPSPPPQSQSVQPSAGIQTLAEVPTAQAFNVTAPATVFESFRKRNLFKSRLFKRNDPDCETVAIAPTDLRNVLDTEYKAPTRGNKKYLRAKKVLAQSLYAQVFKAKSVDTGEIVVIKLLKKGQDSGKELFPEKTEFAKEVKALQQTNLFIDAWYKNDDKGKSGGIIQKFVSGEQQYNAFVALKGDYEKCQAYQKYFLTQLRDFCIRSEFIHLDAHSGNAIKLADGNLEFIDYGLIQFKSDIVPLDGETVESQFRNDLRVMLEVVQKTKIKCDDDNSIPGPEYLAAIGVEV